MLIKDFMDATYMDMMVDFVHDVYGWLWDQKDIMLAHQKVIAHEKRFNRNTGKNRQRATLQQSDIKTRD
jgi:hypothetical protein